LKIVFENNRPIGVVQFVPRSHFYYNFNKQIYGAKMINNETFYTGAADKLTTRSVLIGSKEPNQRKRETKTESLQSFYGLQLQKVSIGEFE
jgi:hypothetical protein